MAKGGAQERFGVTPDLTTLGKVIGGGLPVGAYGGPRDLMEQVSPAGGVYQAGTLSGNPLATAAGLAMLEEIDADESLYERLEVLGARLAEGLLDALESAGVSGQVPGHILRDWTIRGTNPVESYPVPSRLADALEGALGGAGDLRVVVAGRTLQRGDRFAIYRGSTYLGRVVAERVLKDNAGCRALLEIQPFRAGDTAIEIP